MDSLTQLALGAAVGVATMGRRTAAWKAALWGGVCGTLPDLDVLIDHGDPVSNMTLHRTETHALFWLTLASLPIAALAARLHGQWPLLKRWWLAVWLALVTHPLLDALTIYGTQLLLPFSDRPVGLGSVFIIDPLVTLPLVAGVLLALLMRGGRGLSWNRAGLAAASAYLAWGVVVQQHVLGVAQRALHQQGLDAPRMFATPTPFNTLLWRIVAVGPDSLHEGYYSLFDDGAAPRFTRHERGMALYDALREAPAVERMAWFSRGFFKMGVAGEGAHVLLTDLRMGQEPVYVFSFVVGRRVEGRIHPQAPPLAAGGRPDFAAAWAWVWRRALGADIAPPGMK